MHPDLLEVAKELNLVNEYKTIRVATGEVVKVEDSISPRHQRILESAFKAGAAKRQWVGLTDEEALDVWGKVDLGDTEEQGALLLYKAIEAKLKAKNT